MTPEASRYLRQVALDDIDLQDRTFCVGDGCSSEALRHAIATDGLLNPPAVCHDEASGRFRIVCGYRRMDALAALGCRDVPAWILPPGSGTAELLGCALRDNLAHRAFNPIEKAAAVVRLRACLRDAESINAWLLRLGLPPALSSIAQAEALCGLEPELQNALVQGNIAERAALRLARMDAPDRAAVWAVLRQVHLSASKQAELIENCMDIARRDGCSIADVVQAAAFRSMPADDRVTAGQRGESVRQHIRRQRFPRLIQREQHFAALRKGLALPPHITLHPPAGFEGDTFRIDIAFTRADQLRQAARRLDALADNSCLPALLGESG